MTYTEFREPDEVLDSLGLVYHTAAEQWMTKATAKRDAEPVKWYEILMAAPHLSLNDIEAYEERKRLSRAPAPGVAWHSH